jgi:hypothetical protein
MTTSIHCWESFEHWNLNYIVFQNCMLWCKVFLLQYWFPAKKNRLGEESIGVVGQEDAIRIPEEEHMWQIGSFRGFCTWLRFRSPAPRLTCHSALTSFLLFRFRLLPLADTDFYSMQGHGWLRSWWKNQPSGGAQQHLVFPWQYLIPFWLLHHLSVTCLFQEFSLEAGSGIFQFTTYTYRKTRADKKNEMYILISNYYTIQTSKHILLYCYRCTTATKLCWRHSRIQL